MSSFCYINSSSLCLLYYHDIFFFCSRALEEKRARLGLVECVNHDLLQPYPVLHEKPGKPASVVLWFHKLLWHAKLSNPSLWKGLMTLSNYFCRLSIFERFPNFIYLCIAQISASPLSICFYIWLLCACNCYCCRGFILKATQPMLFF